MKAQNWYNMHGWNYPKHKHRPSSNRYREPTSPCKHLGVAISTSNRYRDIKPPTLAIPPWGKQKE